MTQRQLVSSGAMWEPVAGYSRPVRVGQWVSVAGTTAAVMSAIGRAHGEVFGDTRPATSMVEVSRLIDAVLLVEIEADAVVP